MLPEDSCDIVHHWEERLTCYEWRRLVTETNTRGGKKAHGQEGRSDRGQQEVTGGNEEGVQDGR